MIAAALLNVILLAVIGGLLSYLHGHKSQNVPGPAGYTTAPHVKLAHSTKLCPGDIVVRPGASLTDAGFRIKLLRLIYNPHVIGPPPDPGTEYLEADVAMTTILSSEQGNGLPLLYYPSIYPVTPETTGVGCPVEIYYPLDTKPSGTTNPYTGARISGFSPDQFQIPGKLSIESRDVASRIPTLPTPSQDGGTRYVPGYTITVYGLFEVIKGDKGQLIWSGSDASGNEIDYVLWHG